MNWSANSITTNLDAQTETSQFVNSLTASTLSVTLSDPYMTGIAWAALFDSAAAYTTSQLAAANHILLPLCEENQDPDKHKCRRFGEIEDPLLRKGGFGDFAHILVKLYYEVAGVTFGLDTYFRLQSFNISHGKIYPQVTLGGVDPQTVAFNQSLANFQTRENETIEENLKRIFNEYDHKVSFCNNEGADYSQKLVMPRAFKEKSVTAEEMVRKYLQSVKGDYLKLPIKEFAKKVSICTRANVNQGCSVFYLGKGLYEGYSITGSVERNLLNLNAEFAKNSALGINYSKAAIGEGDTYKLEDLFPTRRKEKLKKAKAQPAQFPDQFSANSKRLQGDQSSSGYAWTSSGPEAQTYKFKKVNFYGIGVNGAKPIAMLDGTVVSVSRDTGYVLIETNYFIRACKKSESGNPTCIIKPIMQETANLATVKEGIKVNTKLAINQEIGTSTKDKQEFVRFYIPGLAREQHVTISPSLVWKYANPALELTDDEKKKAGITYEGGNQNSPSSPFDQSLGGKGTFIGRVGNTGNSKGAHIHAEFVPPRPIDIRDLEGIISVDGKPIVSYQRTSAYGVQRGNRTHNGVDIAGGAIENKPIELLNGTVVETGVDSGGYGNFVVIDTPKGKILLGHLADESFKDIKTGSGSRTASKYGAGVQGVPSPVGAEIETEFRGIPRALRIIPGRTVLQFITNYDEWIEKGKPSSIDPGIWIPERFSKWLIKGVNYRWTQGDLRVSVSAVTDWGNATSRVPSPKFPDYLKSFQQSKEFSKTRDYYGYIRSLGDLCWKIGNQSSCEVICEEAEEIRSFLERASSPTPDVTGSFPASTCRYEGNFAKERSTVMNEVMGALKSVGITNPVAYAGVLGNFYAESGIRANRHNLENPGSGCGATSGGPLGTTGYGIAQWCGSRQRNIFDKCTRNSNLSCELSFMVKEIREGRDVRPQVVAAMNGARSPEQAADLWNQYFERGTGGIQERRDYSAKIFPGLKCQKIN